MSACCCRCPALSIQQDATASLPHRLVICDYVYLIDRVCSGIFSLVQSKRLEWILSYS